jgi:fido (protein-threonine AMPylation protein)
MGRGGGRRGEGREQRITYDDVMRIYKQEMGWSGNGKREEVIYDYLYVRGYSQKRNRYIGE